MNHRSPEMRIRRHAILLAACMVAGAAAAAPPLATIEAKEARQAVAVDDIAVYAIDNRRIARYDKTTGRPIGRWEASEEKNLQHLNSGVVVDGRLFSAHSNYPSIPMTSSIEIWDTATMRHVGSHSFGVYAGSATWVDTYEDSWWVMFAHYAGRGGAPGKGPEWSTLIQFDRQWQRMAAWTLPAALVAEFSPYSNSGGAWGDDGLLYLTGHDGAWLYVVELPAAGSELVYLTKVAAPIDGQGIAWDRSGNDRRLYGVVRSAKEIRSALIPTADPVSTP